MSNISFWNLLNITQEYITVNYAALLTEKEKLPLLKSYIEKFLRDKGYDDDDELIDRIYSEMAEYSILTKYLGADNLEEININAWNDIALTYTDGKIKKLDEGFRSPTHATDIIKRLLHHSGMIIDNATPIAQGHLPNNTRITVLKEPIVDDGIGVSASIRLLHPSRIKRKDLIDSEMASEEMIDFLEMCIRFGVSIVISGATSSGKTTLLNILTNCITNHKRIYTIEGGARELSARKIQDDKVINNVVSTLARTSDDEKYNVSQEDLVVASLRFNPDVIIIGEMRDVECDSAVEASLTGHTVLSTVHATAGSAAHMRISLLCQKKHPIDFNTSLIQTGQAFPVVVYTHKLENNQRKIMDISECVIENDGKRSYNSLYSYNVKQNIVKNGATNILGDFKRTNVMSKSLEDKLLNSGVPHEIIERFLKRSDSL
ncbi:MAG: ATPase, T2SS/T4P/T4SS family [Clostridia bacterium]